MTDKPNNDQPSSVTLASRRSFLKQSIIAASGVALFGGMSLGMRSAAWAAGGDVETSKAKLGFIALTDAAPLFVAAEKGFFAKYGMTEVEVLKQSSWGTTRDNLVLGSAKNGIDGAHILTPMPYLISAGIVTPNNQPVPMSILARLNLAGQCISVGEEYRDLKIGLDSTPFKAALEAKKAGGKKVSAAVTFPGAPTTCGCATGWPPAASTRTPTSTPSSCRQRRWSPT